MIVLQKHYFTSNEDLSSELREIKYHYHDISFSFYSDLGVFSKDHIDYGSRFLLETFLNIKETPDLKVLDMGCGYGFLGIVIAKIKKYAVDMCDINKRAIHLSKKNMELNGVVSHIFISDVYENVTSKYDVIITNPPIKAGKDILLNILEGATNHLKDDGELWFVMRKDHGLKSTLKILENKYFLTKIDKSKGFYVILAKKR